MPLNISNMAGLLGFMSLTPYSQPPVGIKYSGSRLIAPSYSFPVLYTPVTVLFGLDMTCSPMTSIEQWYSRRSTAPEPIR
ncbi:hypothetical protein TNCV_2146841 [Trichonephila clavipes]|uniref:Uncharacterized protein n=1 Tax=Trichonephila clavipes TaxID=2585209 RepID=A0A8X6SV49_TRICX|nr:hypothetical protein TNCV_2146841 [Trichonephila clavipes]